MSSKLKLYLGRKMVDSLSRSTKFTPTELLPLIHVGEAQPNAIEMNVAVQVLETHMGLTSVNEILKIQPDDIIKNVSTKRDRANRQITFEVDRTIFVRDVLENGSKPDLNMRPKNVVVEFSSPNIAKPFHLGHLRSTIIGNFISNINAYVNNSVTKINYLGDWGTQFGFIKVGVDSLKYTSDQIKQNPLKLLYESYVHANKLAEKDPQVIEQAREEFSKLENGVPDVKNYWQQYIGFSKNELEDTYKRLGVTFDEYNYESMYGAKEIKDVVSLLIKKNIAHKQTDGKWTTKLNNHQNVSILKSDGSTLYLTRDIAAAIDRYKKFNFDKMYYVVDNAQSDHFNALKNILHRMNYPWAERLNHIKFGRIRGMSTRKGTAVFLRDILDECQDLMVKKQIQSPTTKVSINDNYVSDILGISCVIVNDLRQRRQKDYEFSWERVLQTQGDTGIKLQYTHCRLHNIEKNAAMTPSMECVPKFIEQPEVTLLVRELAKFPEVISRANEQLEACILVVYLFHLCNHINKAVKTLQVKGADPDVASQRLFLFKTARDVLGQGMSILGLQPLTQM